MIVALLYDAIQVVPGLPGEWKSSGSVERDCE